MGAVSIQATSFIVPLVLQKRAVDNSMIRVVIADDHPEIRVALRLLLNLSKSIEMIYEASNGQEAVDCVKRLEPDVLVMDIQMPVLDGFEATRQIADLSVNTRVILMSSYRGTTVAEEAALVGAQGFLPKDVLAESLINAIEIVHRGESFFVE
jgi:DNA-binding NarL/FixJ family response regulator